MRFSTVAIALLGAAASTYAQSGYPNCSLPCLISSPLGSCGSRNEVACLCKSDEFVTNVTQCIATACTNTTDLTTAIMVSRENCRLAGVTLTAVPSYLPSSVVTAISPSATKNAASKTSRDTSLALGAIAALAALCL